VRLLRHRQPSQATALAAASIISIVAIMAFAIDAATFFVIRRELQNAADAAALAGAMYLSPDAPTPAPIGNCINPDHPVAPAPRNDTAVRVACHYARLNLEQASRLCNTPSDIESNEGLPYTRIDPGGRPYYVVVVQVSCEAQFSFGRIINLHDRQVSAYAIAALGTWAYAPPLMPVQGPDFLPTWISCVTPPIPGCRDATRLLPD
jgi:Putative Flp pilus-assembly TadE/G-like